MTMPESEIPSSTSEPTQSVPVDAVLPPVPLDAISPTGSTEKPTPKGGINTFFHPASGVLILGIDILAFGSELGTAFLDTWVACIFSFILTLIGVFIIQFKCSHDTKAAAFGKAFLGAFLAGLPFSIFGTILGMGVIALSGLPDPKQMVKDFIKSEFEKPKLPEN